MDKKANAIEVKNLVKKYGSLKAVDDISFKVEQGERFAFLGVNGAGKSTTISVICGIQGKTSGEVLIENKDINQDSKEIKQEIGVVFQNSVLDKKLSVLENLRFRAAMYGLLGNDFKARLNKVSNLLDLKDILNRPVGKLSGGQRRRADIARAIIHSPTILILDEPTTGLDPATRKLVWASIDKMQNDDNLTVFLTTHYMEEAATADRIVIIDKGKIIASGTPLELKNQFASDTLYLYGAKLEDIKKMDLKYKKVPDGYTLELPDISLVSKLMTKYPKLFADFEVIKGRMDDVFINATGRKEQK